MGTRSTARKLAMQLIFQMDPEAGHLNEEKIEYFLKNEKATPLAKKFALNYVGGIESRLKKIDSLIDKSCHHWTAKRIGRIDLAILRLAFYELVFLKETPEKVIINEALELAKKFSTEDSSAFINGVLDGYLKGQKGLAP